MGLVFKMWQNLSQNWLKFKKIWEEIGNFVQNLVEASSGCPKYANDVYMNIHNPNPNPH